MAERWVGDGELGPSLERTFFALVVLAIAVTWWQVEARLSLGAGLTVVGLGGAFLGLDRAVGRRVEALSSAAAAAYVAVQLALGFGLVVVFLRHETFGVLWLLVMPVVA